MLVLKILMVYFGNISSYLIPWCSTYYSRNGDLMGYQNAMCSLDTMNDSMLVICTTGTWRIKIKVLEIRLFPVSRRRLFKISPTIWKQSSPIVEMPTLVISLHVVVYLIHQLMLAVVGKFIGHKFAHWTCIYKKVVCYRWAFVSDEFVSELQDSEPFRFKPYLLFYEKRIKRDYALWLGDSTDTRYHSCHLTVLLFKFYSSTI